MTEPDSNRPVCESAAARAQRSRDRLGTVCLLLGLAGIALLRAFALLLRVLSNGFRHLGTLAERLYDLPLFVPLWLESRLTAARTNGDHGMREARL